MNGLRKVAFVLVIALTMMCIMIQFEQQMLMS